ncbi:SPASM domain-containing protein [Thermococcus piezophilus]|uniref:SPASM domain-containing protein n=1 Tax=Thermococcus piezophilus TaxID=1712654 RepID=UPI0009EE0DE4|nr:SPASM domain-containing protein [Thermococcus piezophilus]
MEMQWTMQKYLNVPQDVAVNIFRRSIHNIKLLKRENIDVHVKSVISTVNIQILWEHLTFLDSLGVSHVTLLHYLPIGKGAINKGPSMLNSDMLVQFFNTINRANNELEITVDYRSFLSIYTPALTPEFNYDNCPTGTMDLRIRYDGKIIQCSSVWDIFLGDLRKESLETIWRNALNRRDLTKCPFASGSFPPVRPEYSYCLLKK